MINTLSKKLVIFYTIDSDFKFIPIYSDIPYTYANLRNLHRLVKSHTSFVTILDPRHERIQEFLHPFFPISFPLRIHQKYHPSEHIPEFSLDVRHRCRRFIELVRPK